MKKVICNATNEEVSMEYCRNCSLNIPSPCSYDYALIKRVHAAVQPREGTHVTDLVHCLRRAYYQATDPVPEQPADVMYRVLGTATHALLEDEGDENLMTETPLEYEGIVGTVDAYYPKTKTLVDYKTTRWLKKAYLPYGDHTRQVNVYRWLLTNNGYEVDKMFLHYIDLSGPSKCRSCKIPLIEQSGIFLCPICGKLVKGGHHGTAMVEVPVDIDTESFIRRRKEILDNAYVNNQPPAGDPSFLCEYCQFNSICPDADVRERSI